VKAVADALDADFGSQTSWSQDQGKEFVAFHQ
jgi:hypothetical protein